jgi:hypothetical protein
MKLRDTHTPAIAGAKAGFSTATAYLLEKELHLRPAGKPPRERRRPDPLIDIWDSEIVPMLSAVPGLMSVAIIEEMNRRYPGIYLGMRRTMERRIRGWRGPYSPEQEGIFRQTHESGRMGLSDFTDMADPAITIAGEPLDHRLYHFRLVDSGFEHAHVVLGARAWPWPKGFRTLSGHWGAPRSNIAATACRRPFATSMTTPART